MNSNTNVACVGQVILEQFETMKSLLGVLKRGDVKKTLLRRDRIDTPLIVGKS